MNWHINQEIVCIKTHSEGIVKEGQVYTIKGLKSFCSCGIAINVGISSYSVSNVSFCPNCYVREKGDGIRWLSEQLFAPLEYDKQAIEELISITKKETITK